MESVNFAADRRSCVTRVGGVDPNIKVIESNQETKTDNLKSCVTFGDHFSHPNKIEMRVNNLFNISRLLETELILKTLVLLGLDQLKSSGIFQIILFISSSFLSI